MRMICVVPRFEGDFVDDKAHGVGLMYKHNAEGEDPIAFEFNMGEVVTEL